MTATEKETIHKLAAWFAEAQALSHRPDPLLVTPSGVTAAEAVQALRAVERDLTAQAFRIDFNCGCFMRLYFDQPPKVFLRDGVPVNHPDCVLARMVFVAE